MPEDPAPLFAFSSGGDIWSVPATGGDARGAATSPTPERVRQTNQFSDLALSPDGRKVAFIAHGDVFAAIESQASWAPDSRRLAFVETTRSGQHLSLYDFAAGTRKALTSGSVTDLSPVFSPDGTRIAFLRNHKELRARANLDELLANTVDRRVALTVQRAGTSREVTTTAARSVLGQRALESPTILLTNQHSLSDAEDFAEGYRTMKLGPVVGEPTAGWTIYTWDARLVDGSTLRLPRMRVKAADSGDMEMVPRKVDVAVSRPLGESAAGKDSQLDEAIRTLLRRLGRAE